MGCSTSHPNDGRSIIKSEPLRQFFNNCLQLQFNEAYVCKKTIYEYKYSRGLREWVLINDKQLFIDEQPVLLSPCQPEQFQQLLEKIQQFKNKSLDQVEQLQGFPKNIGMLLQIGLKFPSFSTSLLGSNTNSIFEIALNQPCIFVHWKLQEKISISKSPSNQRNQLLSSRGGGLFKQTNKSFIENAFQRVVNQIKKLNNNTIIVGICEDTPESKPLYEEQILDQQINQYRHIWIEKNISIYSTDQNDHNPYENQAFQVFRFAQNEVQNVTRGLENSVYLVNQDGIFQGVLKENFSDEGFIDNIVSAISNRTIIEPQNSQQNTQNYINRITTKDNLTQQEYRKFKTILRDKIQQYVKQGVDCVQIGDTFSFRLEKFTYFANYRKVTTFYKRPTLNAAASIKYHQNLDQIMNSLKGEFSSDNIIKDFKRRQTIDKKAFFKMLSQKMRDFGWDDIRFILERHQVIHFSSEYNRFVLDRKLDYLHNAPISIGSVFARNGQIDQTKAWLLQNESKLAQPVINLLKQFLSNQYSLSSAFHVGQIYSPIPNVYQIKHNTSVHETQNTIAFSSQQPTSSPYFQTQQLQASLQNSQMLDKSSNQSQIQSNRQFVPQDNQGKAQSQQEQPQSQQEECQGRDIEISVNWEGQDNFDEMNYDQTHALKQIKNEVLVIFQLDFNKNGHLNTLTTLLTHIAQKKWTKEQIRVASIATSIPDFAFDNALTTHKLEKDMSRGIYEPWFALEQTYNGVVFNKVLEDLYELDCKSEEKIIIIDTHKKLAYRGILDNKLIQQLDSIVDGSNSNTIYPFDHLLRNRIRLAQYEREWNKIKSFGYFELKKDQSVLDLELFLKKNPLNNKEFWKLEIRSFELWSQKGILVGKFYERPRIGYRLERPHLKAKFEHLNQNIIKQLGVTRIDVNDLKEQNLPQVIVTQSRAFNTNNPSLQASSFQFIQSPRDSSRSKIQQSNTQLRSSFQQSSIQQPSQQQSLQLVQSIYITPQ